MPEWSQNAHNHFSEAVKQFAALVLRELFPAPGMDRLTGRPQQNTRNDHQLEDTPVGHGRQCTPGRTASHYGRMTFERDPASVAFDGAARRLLERAYASPGQWVGTYLSQPSTGWIAWGWAHGIGLRERDRWGEVRWVRAYKRAVYWQLRTYGYARELGTTPRVSDTAARSLEWETGKLIMKKGWPGRRWAIRVRLHAGGLAAERAVRSKRPPAERYTGPAGQDYRSDVASR